MASIYHWSGHPGLMMAGVRGRLANHLSLHANNTAFAASASSGVDALTGLSQVVLHTEWGVGSPAQMQDDVFVAGWQTGAPGVKVPSVWAASCSGFSGTSKVDMATLGWSPAPTVVIKDFLDAISAAVNTAIDTLVYGTAASSGSAVNGSSNRSTIAEWRIVSSGVHYVVSMSQWFFYNQPLGSPAHGWDVVDVSEQGGQLFPASMAPGELARVASAVEDVGQMDTDVSINRGASVFSVRGGVVTG